MSSIHSQLLLLPDDKEEQTILYTRHTAASSSSLSEEEVEEVETKGIDALLLLSPACPSIPDILPLSVPELLISPSTLTDTGAIGFFSDMMILIPITMKRTNGKSRERRVISRERERDTQRERERERERDGGKRGKWKQRCSEKVEKKKWKGRSTDMYQYNINSEQYDNSFQVNWSVD